jgi:copper transport protein
LSKQAIRFLLASFVAASGVAYAHSELVGSIPADHAAVAAAPTQVMLQFSEAVRLTALAVQKEGQPKQSMGPLPADAAEHFMVSVPASGDGRYTVTWRALSDDSHVVAGEFSYMVGAAGAQTAAADAGHAGPADHAHMHMDHSGTDHHEGADHSN